MHPSPQETHSPAIGHLEQSEGQTHGSPNPKLGSRIKAAASSFATKLHIPGTGHSSSSGPGLAAAEHHRVTAHHVAPETLSQRPQWQVEQPLHLQQQQQQSQHRDFQEEPQLSYEMPPSPATPLRDIERETDTAREPLATEEEPRVPAPEEGAPQAVEQQFEVSTSSARSPSGSPVAGLEHGQAPARDDPHYGAGSPTISTPFSGVESPQRLSSDTDELKTFMKPVPSLDRSTESQEVYVEDLEILVEDKARVGGVAGGLGGKSAAQRLRHAGPALQPAVQEEEGEGEMEEEEEEEEEQHTHFGPSPYYSSYQEEKEAAQSRSAKAVEPVAFAAGGGGAAAALSPMFSPTEEDEKRSSIATAAAKKSNTEQENLEQEIYAAVEAEEQLEKEEEEEDKAIAAARRRVEREEAEGRGHPKAMTHPLESPSGKLVIPALEVPVRILFGLN
jgi:hypothetical protein